ncbi:hypothetical protein [Herbidospora galbida]|uniref:hypothetical protein n=1 Tax=Herbidospora galbida TaxID=2575442 RepID=UPI0014852E44|nr:hypothetical protein [Herbidospora galbida]
MRPAGRHLIGSTVAKPPGLVPALTVPPDQAPAVSMSSDRATLHVACKGAGR